MRRSAVLMGNKVYMYLDRRLRAICTVGSDRQASQVMQRWTRRRGR